MKNSLSRRLFQKYGLPPRGYQWGATSFLPTQGMWKQCVYYPVNKRFPGDLSQRKAGFVNHLSTLYLVVDKPAAFSKISTLLFFMVSVLCT